jgi:hypothetical protein
MLVELGLFGESDRTQERCLLDRWKQARNHTVQYVAVAIANDIQVSMSFRCNE